MTQYLKWLQEESKNTPCFHLKDRVRIKGDSGEYTIVGRTFEPILGRDIFVLAQGDRVRFCITDNMMVIHHGTQKSN